MQHVQPGSVLFQKKLVFLPMIPHRYQQELQQALAEQAARTPAGSDAGKAGTLSKPTTEELEQLRAQVEHQDKQKKLLRQK